MMHPPRWHFIDVNHINNVPSIRLYVPKKRQEIWVGIYKERERERATERGGEYEYKHSTAKGVIK